MVITNGEQISTDEQRAADLSAQSRRALDHAHGPWSSAADPLNRDISDLLAIYFC
jgi:hypothetical protein